MTTYVDESIDINAVNVSGYIALHVACIGKDLSEVERLLAAGANVNALTTNSSMLGLTPLHNAQSRRPKLQRYC